MGFERAMAATLACVCTGAAVAGEGAQDRGVPVDFALGRPAVVTLVVEDASGRRVRNLIAGTRFEAGEHRIYWDGYDEGERVGVSRTDGKGFERHYDIHRQLVEPGVYRVRGLAHDGLGLRYQMSVQSPGTPPWHTADGSGAWLSDHAPPVDVLHLPDGSPHGRQPQLLVSAPIAETGHNVMWLDEQGRKLFGAKLSGWSGALALCRDAGRRQAKGVYAYGVLYRRGQLQLWALHQAPNDAGDTTRNLLKHDAGDYDRLQATAIDVAAHDGIVVVSLPKENLLLFVDAHRRKRIGEAAVADPRGVAFAEGGELLVLSGVRLLAYDDAKLGEAQLGEPTVLVEGLDDPRRVRVAPDGTLLISEWGERHQVRRFDRRGRLLATVGEPGGPQYGVYDPRRMHFPVGMAVAGDGRLWVAEADYAPKRLSVWSSGGEFDHAFYGPPKYGGGGFVDPIDPTRFYYGSGLQGIQFRLDWERGTAVPAAIYYLRKDEEVGARTPDYPIYLHGRLYMVNCYSGRPFGWKATDASVFLFDSATSKVEHLARVGTIQEFLAEFAKSDPALAARLVQDNGAPKFNFYAWSDLNRDATPQADEVQSFAIRDEQMQSRAHSGVGFGRDLSIITTGGLYLPPPDFTSDGVPVWNMGKARLVTPVGSYQADVINTSDGHTILTGGPIAAYRDDQPAWTYHSQWPKRGGPMAPPPAYPGQLMATSRIIGDSILPPAGDAGEMWAINNDKGSIYLFTSDGLFVDELGGDLRVTPPFQMPAAERDMLVPRASFNDEHFWPALMQLADGRVLLTIGKEHSSLFRLEGLESVRRLAASEVTVSADMLAGQPTTMIEPAVQQERKRLEVAIVNRPPSMRGVLDDWSSADWQTINERRNIRAAMLVHDDTLYIAYRAESGGLLNNHLSDGWEYAFASGGGLDLMVRTRPSQERREPTHRHRDEETAAAGDVRLFLTRAGDTVNGRVVAVRYEQKRSDGKRRSVEFISPVGRVEIESVTDVSEHVRLFQNGELYEVAVPLRVLGFEPRPGMETIGDLGVLIGDGRDTHARLYWNNRSAGITTDLPSEARLTPEYWGDWVFRVGE